MKQHLIQLKALRKWGLIFASFVFFILTIIIVMRNCSFSPEYYEKEKFNSKELSTISKCVDKLATECLVAIEHFSVGVNNGIFDKKIVKECGGAYFCRLYQFLKPVIEKKKVTSPDGEHYDNFTKLYNTLLKYYKDKDIYYHPTKN